MNLTKEIPPDHLTPCSITFEMMDIILSIVQEIACQHDPLSHQKQDNLLAHTRSLSQLFGEVVKSMPHRNAVIL